MSPIILHANTYRFAPGEEIRSGPVASRMQVWCLDGLGSIEVDGQREDLPPGRVVLLPWGFRIRYRAARRRPFRLAGIHCIPRAADLADMPFSRVPHQGESIAGLEPGDDPACQGLHRRAWSDQDPWHQLSTYLVATFQRGRPEITEQRRLAAQLITEWRRALAPPLDPTDPGLAAIRDYVHRHPRQALGLADLAAIAACAPATLDRRVRRAHGCSPTRWVQSLRVDLAKDRLRTDDRPLGEIATALGFCDLFYFSRVFKRHVGQSPRAWRQGRTLL